MAEAQAHFARLAVDAFRRPAKLGEFGVEEHGIAVVVDDEGTRPDLADERDDRDQRTGRVEAADVDVFAAALRPTPESRVRLHVAGSLVNPDCRQ
jgi:hypothetical protein